LRAGGQSCWQDTRCITLNGVFKQPQYHSLQKVAIQSLRKRTRAITLSWTTPVTRWHWTRLDTHIFEWHEDFPVPKRGCWLCTHLQA
jgi:hypothetical protein